MSWASRRALLGLVLCAAGGCASGAASLRQAQDLYAEARYEAALEWLHDLEADTASMRPRDRATFYYLRGMTAYRLSRRDEALHYLALASSASASAGLPSQQRSVMEHVLNELMPRDATHHARNPLRPDTM